MTIDSINYQQSIRALSLPVPDSHTLFDIFEIEGDSIVQAIDAFKSGNERAQNYLNGICMPSRRRQKRGLSAAA